MKLPTLQFPQNSRLFSAPIFLTIIFWGERIMFWSLLMALLYFNVTAIAQTQKQFTTQFIPAIKHPFSARIHMEIASTLWSEGHIDEAKKEILIAEDLTPPDKTSVLGTSTSPSTLLAQWESQPIIREKHYNYWKTMLKQKPDFRDAYIQAAAISHELGYLEEARALLKKAHALDPNFQTTSTFLREIHE